MVDVTSWTKVLWFTNIFLPYCSACLHLPLYIWYCWLDMLIVYVIQFCLSFFIWYLLWTCLYVIYVSFKASSTYFSLGIIIKLKLSFYLVFIRVISSWLVDHDMPSPWISYAPSHPITLGTRYVIVPLAYALLFVAVGVEIKTNGNLPIALLLPAKEGAASSRTEVTDKVSFKPFHTSLHDVWRFS